MKLLICLLKDVFGDSLFHLGGFQSINQQAGLANDVPTARQVAFLGFSMHGQPPCAPLAQEKSESHPI